MTFRLENNQSRKISYLTEFDETPRFWCPRVARVAWIDFSSRTIELQQSECRENLPPLFLSLFSISLYPFFFYFSPSSTKFPLLVCSYPISIFSFSHFSPISIFLHFLFYFIFFLLSLYLILIHPPNLSTSGETSPHFPPCHLSFSYFFS